MDAEMASGSAAVPGSDRSAKAGRRRIVLIEDDADLRRLIQATLELLGGWQVTAAADGSEGIAATLSVAPDAVLVDLMMPGIDGYEVCRRLKDNPATTAIPIVLMTARGTLDVASATAAGASGLVFKPFELDELDQQIRQACRL